MGLSERWAETIYRFATARSKLKIILTPVGLVFWFGFSVLLIYAAVWLDKFIPASLLPVPINIFLSIPLLVTGATLVFWSVYCFIKSRGTPVPLNPPQKLVVTAIYSLVRNPMVLGWSILLFSAGLLLNSISLAFIFTPLFILLNVLYLKAIEEKEMEKKFGEQYLEYKKSVPMFIPRLGKKRS